MSLNFIHDFQIMIYKLLNEEEDIMLNVDRIYLSIVQDAKYPFLLINILKVINISEVRQRIYEIEFEICAFARDKKHIILTLLADIISSKLVPNSCKLPGNIVAGLKICNLEFHKSSDLVTSKLTINFKSLIKENF